MMRTLEVEVVAADWISEIFGWILIRSEIMGFRVKF